MACDSCSAAPCFSMTAVRLRGGFFRHNPLVIHNVNRGISQIVVEGIGVKAYKHFGQHFMIPSAAFVNAYKRGERHAVEVAVFDINGDSYGSFQIPADPGYIAQQCEEGKWAVKVLTGAHYLINGVL